MTKIYDDIISWIYIYKNIIICENIWSKKLDNLIYDKWQDMME